MLRIQTYKSILQLLCLSSLQQSNYTASIQCEENIPWAEDRCPEHTESCGAGHGGSSWRAEGQGHPPPPLTSQNSVDSPMWTGVDKHSIRC